MKQPVEVRTPVATGDAQKLGKVWRKQVLPFGTIKVGDRDLNFTPEYCRQVADAFADQAYDTAPIMLADKTNDHTMALLDEGGEVLGLDVDEHCDSPGLYATVKLSAPVEERVDRNRRCGVSVRIRENYNRADGRFYPAAMQHLLLTWDPKVPGMKPWEQVDLSNSTDQVVVIDLSNYSYGDTSDGASGTTPTSEGAAPMALTKKELDELRASQERVNALLAKADTDDTTDEAAEVDEDADAEFAKEAAGLFEDWDDDVTDDDTDPDGDGGEEADTEGAEQRELVSASNDADNGALDLSNSGRDADRQRILDLSNQLDDSNYKAERDAMARKLGLPPSLIDLAEPLLKGQRNVVELSNGSGEKVDAGKIVRDLLNKFGSMVQLLDLSAAIGADEPETTEQQEAKTRRQANVDAILANIN